MIFLTGQEDPQASGGKEPWLLCITVVICVVARFLAITTLLATVLQLVHPLRLKATAAWHAVVGVVMLVGVVAVAASCMCCCVCCCSSSSMLPTVACLLLMSVNLHLLSI